MALKEIKENILSFSKKEIIDASLEAYIEYYSEWFNLYPHNDPKKDLFDIKKYLLFT